MPLKYTSICSSAANLVTSSDLQQNNSSDDSENIVHGSKNEEYDV